MRSVTNDRLRLIVLVSASVLMAHLCLWPRFDGMADGGLVLASEIQNLKSEIQDGRGEQSTEPHTSTEQAERKELARQYSRGWYWFYFVNQGYTFLMLFLILWTGFSARLRRWAERATPRRWGIILIYSGLFMVLLAVLSFPLDIFAFWREKRYGFATQNVTGWLGDELKELGVALVLGLPAILVVYAVFKKAPRRWAVTKIVRFQNFGIFESHR